VTEFAPPLYYKRINMYDWRSLWMMVCARVRTYISKHIHRVAAAVSPVSTTNNKFHAAAFVMPHPPVKIYSKLIFSPAAVIVFIGCAAASGTTKQTSIIREIQWSARLVGFMGC
jgi:hypothetical protein